MIFPQGEFEVIFTIHHEDDETVFSEKNIFIKNTPEIFIINSVSEDKMN
jgi:hypothetical protein